MEVSQDDLCFILDLGFLYQQDLSRTRIGLLHLEWSTRTPCFLHPPTLQDFELQREANREFLKEQDSRTHLPTHPNQTFLKPPCVRRIGQKHPSDLRDMQRSQENRGRLQGRTCGKRLITKTDNSFFRSRNFGLSQERCVKNSISPRFIVTQLWFLPRR